MERPKGENEGMDDKKRQHEEDALDEALRESFPASDPIAVHPQVPPPNLGDMDERKTRRTARRKRPAARKTKKRPKTRSRKKAGKKKPARRSAKKRSRKTAARKRTRR